jgi:hypothetical protein
MSTYRICVPSSGSSKRASAQPVSFRRMDSLVKLAIGHRIDELLELLDPQASVVVRYDVCDEEHLAVHLHPKSSLGQEVDLRDRG